jgi:hypothetical protein
MKKAQGMSMNVIIIAALALIVLVILAVVFMNKMGGFVTETDTCENNGGRCVYGAPIGSNPCGEYEVRKTGRNYMCPGNDPDTDEDNGICCVGVDVPT